MKRFAAIIFTLIYLVSSTGVVWSNFYCCGKLKHTYVFGSPDFSKNCKGDKETKGCCDTKTVFSKVKDDHSPSAYKANVSDEGKVLSSFPALIYTFNNTQKKLFSLSHDPPLLSEQPVYLALNNFRI